MSKIFTIQLNSFDLGQLMDGLQVRADAWRNTQKHHETGESPEEFFICEECNGAHEAEQIVITKIESQMKEQGGS